MRIFIYTQTAQPITLPIVLDTIRSLVNTFTHYDQNEIVIVGSNLPKSFQDAFVNRGQLLIVSEKQASLLYNEPAPAKIIHFGTHIKSPNPIPKLFIPLSLPNEKPGSFIKQYFLKKQFDKWLKKASQVGAIHEWALDTLKTAFPSYASKMELMQLPGLQVPYFEWYQLAKLQEALTNGHNYFLCFAPLERFTTILKSFSVFKKWQQTTMHLVFVMDHANDIALASQQLKGYKFKQDIVLLHANDFCMEWLAASYTILWEGVSFSKFYWMRYAIAYEVPLLIDKAVGLPDSWLKAGEVFSFVEPQALSNHFKLYYKDEMYRQTKARAAKDWAHALLQ